MKTKMRALAAVFGMFCAASSFAQSAATTAVGNATAAATDAVNKAKESAAAAVAAKVAAPAAAPASAPVAAAPAPAKAVAGGAGKVWANSASKSYHCEGSKFYGKTKKGEYMTEADAKAKGFHAAAKGKACTK